MAGVSTPSKGKVAVKTAKVAVKHPRLFRAGTKAAKPAAKFGFKVARPVVKRRVRQKVAGVGELATQVGELATRAGELATRVGELARTTAVAVVTYGPPAAYAIGLVEPPKEKRTAPRVIAGIVIGAAAVYFLEPEHGGEHRQKAMSLVR